MREGLESNNTIYINRTTIRYLTSNVFEEFVSGEEFPWKSVSLKTVQEVDWSNFEDMVGDLYEEMGYKTEVRGGRGGDKKIDVLARKRGLGGKTLAIQVKRYKNKITRPMVQEYYGIHTQVGADECVIITTSTFNDEALEFADRLGIRVIDGEDLLLKMERHASLSFFLKYAEDLNLTEQEIRQEFRSRNTRSLAERLITRGKSAFGRGELLIGQLFRSLGWSLIRWKMLYHQIMITIHGYDPTLFAEQTDNDGRAIYIRNAVRLPSGEDNGDQNDDLEPPQRALKLDRTGRTLTQRGIAKIASPLVSWKLNGRALIPSMGVKPVLRHQDSFSLARQSVLVLVGIICCLFVVGASLSGFGVTVGSYPLATLLVFASVTATIGILLPTLMLSQTPTDAARAIYGIPVASPVFIWLFAGYPAVENLLYRLTGCIIVTSSIYLTHTWYTQKREHPTPKFSPSSIDWAYYPVYNHVTIFGVFGTGLLWFALALTPIVSTDSRALWQSLQEWLLLAALVIIVLSGVVYTWYGGLVGVTGGVLVVSSVLVLINMEGTSTLTGTIDTFVVLTGVFVVLVTAIYLLYRTRHRTIDRWHVVSTVLVLLLVLEVTDYWPLIRFTEVYGTVGLQSIIVLNAVGATILFLTVLSLEQQAIRRTLEK